MLSIIPFMLKYRYAIVGLVVLAFLLGIYMFGYSKGSAKERGICEMEKSNAIERNIDIREMQDRVVNLDDNALANSLRRGEF